MCVRTCVRVCMCVQARVCIGNYLQACGLGVDVSGKCLYVIIMLWWFVSFVFDCQ